MIAVICAVFCAVVAPGNLHDSIDGILPNSAFGQPEGGGCPNATWRPVQTTTKSGADWRLLNVHSSQWTPMHIP